MAVDSAALSPSYSMDSTINIALTKSTTEIDRAYVFRQVIAGSLCIPVACSMLGISIRQCNRMLARLHETVNARQIDGSHHAWFEDRGPSCCLFVFIDDASNRTYFRFAATENVHDALLTLRRYLERFGIFEQAYTDRGAV